MISLLQAALGYASRGVPVFRLVPNGKRPLPDGHSFHDATTDPAVIAAWWAEAEYNIGAEPARAGLAVVDLDDKNGHTGSATWSSLAAQNGQIPETLTVRTPSGGLHLYFAGGAPSSAGRLGDGIDIRSRGGYVLLPPSIVDGKLYTIVKNLPPAPLPAWIAAALARPEHAPATAPEGVVADPEGVEAWAVALIEAMISRDGPAEPGHALNERTFALAAMLKDGPQFGYTISEDLAVALIAEHWSTADRVEQTVRNAYGESGQNAPGCGQAGSASRKYDPLVGVRPYDPEPAQVERPILEPAPVVPAVNSPATIRNGAGFKLAKVEWLWPGWLAQGKFHILGGQKGAGKSTLSFSLLAQITVGGRWPDGATAPLGDVLIWSGEDDVADTILPRLVAAGGDPGRVWFPDRVGDPETGRHFDPATDFPSLLDACRRLSGLKVILVDPIVSASAADSHKNAETRRGLQPLVDFAAETGAAVIGITHFTKNTQGRDPIERITGTLAYGALPRVVWGASQGEGEEQPRRLVRIASNIGQSGGGFEYALQQQCVVGHDFDAQRVLWGRPLAGSAKDLIEGAEGGGKGLRAVALLNSLLAPAGTAGMFVREVKTAAEAHGVSWATVERAKAKMTIEAFKNLGDDRAPWSWRLIAPGDG